MDGIEISPAAMNAGAVAFEVLANDLWGDVPDPWVDPVRAFAVWTQLEAWCQVAAMQVVSGVPEHHLDWERLGAVIGESPGCARSRYGGGKSSGAGPVF